VRRRGRDVVRLFGWLPELAQRTIAGLVQKGRLVEGLSHPQMAGEWVPCRSG